MSTPPKSGKLNSGKSKSAKPADAGSEIAEFETSLDELELLVEQMESGDLSLEDSLQAFERGVALTRSCQRALKNAELRVQTLTAGEIDLDDEDANDPDAPD